MSQSTVPKMAEMYIGTRTTIECRDPYYLGFKEELLELRAFSQCPAYPKARPSKGSAGYGLVFGGFGLVGLMLLSSSYSMSALLNHNTCEPDISSSSRVVPIITG